MRQDAMRSNGSSLGLRVKTVAKLLINGMETLLWAGLLSSGRAMAPSQQQAMAVDRSPRGRDWRLTVKGGGMRDFQLIRPFAEWRRSEAPSASARFNQGFFFG
jgi:hypothetical protein